MRLRASIPIAGVAVVLCAMLAQGVAATTAGAAFPGRNGKIVYDIETLGGPRRALWTINSSGTQPRRIFAPAQSFQSDFQVSPDGITLAFSWYVGSRTSLYTMRIDGTGRTRLTNPDESTVDADPTWSPDGGLFYQRNPRIGGADLYRLGTPGSIFATALDVDHRGEPTWGGNGNSSTSVSPSGTQLVAVRSSTVAAQYPGEPPTSHTEELWIVGTDGQNARQLTSWGNLTGANAGVPRSEVRWSGQGIIYFTAAAKGATKPNPVYNLYRITPSGTDLAMVAPNVGAFDVAPNGAWVAYRHLTSGRIMRTDKYGRGGVALTASSFKAGGEPKFSPDSRRIVFPAYRASNDPVHNKVQLDLFTMRFDGADKRRVTKTLGSHERVVDWQRR